MLPRLQDSRKGSFKEELSESIRAPPNPGDGQSRPMGGDRDSDLLPIPACDRLHNFLCLSSFSLNSTEERVKRQLIFDAIHIEPKLTQQYGDSFLKALRRPLRTPEDEAKLQKIVSDWKNQCQTLKAVPLMTRENWWNLFTSDGQRMVEDLRVQIGRLSDSGWATWDQNVIVFKDSNFKSDDFLDGMTAFLKTKLGGDPPNDKWKSIFKFERPPTIRPLCALVNALDHSDLIADH